MASLDGVRIIKVDESFLAEAGTMHIEVEFKDNVYLGYLVPKTHGSTPTTTKTSSPRGRKPSQPAKKIALVSAKQSPASVASRTRFELLLHRAGLRCCRRSAGSAVVVPNASVQERHAARAAESDDESDDDDAEEEEEEEESPQPRKRGRPGCCTRSCNILSYMQLRATSMRLTAFKTPRWSTARSTIL
jgi:hypothetical protein